MTFYSNIEYNFRQTAHSCQSSSLVEGFERRVGGLWNVVNLKHSWEGMIHLLCREGEKK